MFNTGDRFCTVEVCFHSKLHLSSSSKATTPLGLQDIKLACCSEFLEYTSLLFMLKLVVKNRMNFFPKATAYLAFLLVILSNLSERLPIWRFNSFRDNLSNLWEKALLMTMWFKVCQLPYLNVFISLNIQFPTFWTHCWLPYYPIHIFLFHSAKSCFGVINWNKWVFTLYFTLFWGSSIVSCTQYMLKIY